MKRTPTMIKNTTRPIFQVTKEQEKQALALYPGLFTRREDLRPVEGTRAKRQLGPQICLPTLSWNTLYIAVNYMGNIVQLLQVRTV